MFILTLLSIPAYTFFLYGNESNGEETTDIKVILSSLSLGNIGSCKISAFVFKPLCSRCKLQLSSFRIVYRSPVLFRKSGLDHVSWTWCLFRRQWAGMLRWYSYEVLNRMFLRWLERNNALEYWWLLWGELYRLTHLQFRSLQEYASIEMPCQQPICVRWSIL